MENLNETETQIVCVYLVQMLGTGTVDKVREVLNDKMGLKLSKIKVTNALNSAKKRGIVSVNHVQSEDGRVEDAYSMKDARFTNPPEVAHFKNILPKLLEDEGTKNMWSEMEDIHTEGEKKGGRLPDIRDYKKVEIECVNLLPVLGGQPFAGNGESKSKITHRRVGKMVWLPTHLWLRGAIAPMLRQYNLNESKSMYLFSNDIIESEDKFEMAQYTCASPPQRRGGQGTGLVTFEGIKEGHTFKFKLRFPTTNGIPVETMREIFESGIRIGARHRDYGLLKMTDFRVVG